MLSNIYRHRNKLSKDNNKKKMVYVKIIYHIRKKKKSRGYRMVEEVKMIAMTCTPPKVNGK